MEEEVRALLKAGLPDLPVEFGALQPGMPLPALVLNTIAELPAYNHSGVSAVTEYLLQVDCYALTVGEAKRLHRQVKDLLQPPLAFLEGAGDGGREAGPDEAVRPWRVSADYRVFHAVPATLTG